MKSAQEILTSHNKFLIKLGLERIEKILELLGNPQNGYKIIHIAGTNGKGSTSKIINDILIKKGYKTALFISPHIFCYTERIRVNNEEISPYLFDKLINEIDLLAQKNNIELSEFELITACAFYCFNIKNPDYIVLETGLGGLYDATNIIKKSIPVITTIDFDHTERLGKTIDEIALQKAGIIKPKSKVVISKENKGYKIIKKIADEKNSKIIPLKDIKIEFENGKNYAVFDGKKTEFSLLGAHQAQNLALAFGVLDILKIKIDDEVLNTLKEIKWDFRLQYDKKNNTLIDCAHNPSGIKTLRNFLDENFKEQKKSIIFGCLKNKDYRSMLDILLKDEDEFYFMEYDYPNSLKFDELDEKYKSRAKKITKIDEVLKKKNLKVFSGSIYMLGKIFKK